jgi:YCII-related domain
VYVFAGGLENQPASIVAADGAVTDGPYPEAIGGFALVDVPSREEALQWAAKIAVACRCAQEVREIGADPNSTQCSARLTADGDVPAGPDRRRPAALEQDLPWRRSDYAGLRIDLGRDRRAALLRTA